MATLAVGVAVTVWGLVEDLEVLLVVLANFALVVLVDAVFDLELPRLKELVVSGVLITFWALGVGVDVQYHVPLANAQAWPSLALPYESDWLIIVPSGSSSQAWPPLLDKLKPVSTEKKAVKFLDCNVVPDGKV